MHKTDVYKAVAEKTGFSQVNIKEVVKALEDVIVETLTENKEEKIPFAIGNFVVKHVPAKSGTSVLGGGKEWHTPDRDVITYRAAKSKKFI